MTTAWSTTEKDGREEITILLAHGIPIILNAAILVHLKVPRNNLATKSGQYYT